MPVHRKAARGKESCATINAPRGSFAARKDEDARPIYPLFSLVRSSNVGAHDRTPDSCLRLAGISRRISSSGVRLGGPLKGVAVLLGVAVAWLVVIAGWGQGFPDTFFQPKAVHAQWWGWGGDSSLLARVIMGEAGDEPFIGQVAVGAVIMNRVRHPSFPNTLSGVIFEPDAFESVSNGLIWSREPSATQYTAASLAMSGWDPTFGALYFWNPFKAVSPWVWTRQIIMYIGRHVFAR